MEHDERIETVTVRLRYAVTGSKSAAEKALFNAFRQGQGRVERIAGDDYEARSPIVDINPGECEGYENYETFSIAVWLKSSRGHDHLCRAQARNVLLLASENKLDDLTPELAMGDWLKDYVEKLLDVDRRENSASTDEERMFVSLAQAALSDVNWRELCEEWIRTVREG
jgi:hypothetical protein